MPATVLPLPSVLANSRKADPRRLGYIGAPPVSKARDGDAWFTPDVYIDSVRGVLGDIDLDPFSSEAANKVVRAQEFFSEERSAFEYDWRIRNKTRVFMNPPYSAGVINRAISRFIDQFESHAFVEGIVLVNNATDTRWFKALVSCCQAVCFTDHRISFWNADGKHVSNNTRGQAFFYFGSRSGKFKRIFKKHGFVLVPADVGRR